MKQAALLWTGGKDSFLALQETRRLYSVRALVTFTPPNPRFFAHPLPMLQRQAQRLGLPLWCRQIEGEAGLAYDAALRELRDKDGIEVLITGDIAEVNGQPNWIRQRGEPLGLEVQTPLWGRDRAAVWSALHRAGCAVIISYIREGSLDAKWLGQEISAERMEEFARDCSLKKTDLCGENGEFHTLVTNGPGFARPIRILEAATGAEPGFYYWDIGKTD